VSAEEKQDCLDNSYPNILNSHQISPILQLTFNLLEACMPEIDQTVSRYRIVEKIGQGGMGEVYLADDTTLDRKVALKFLPEAFTSDPERMARFEREAKLLASLNHPNIAGIHGLEQSEESRFLVLEYVEGETLKARLSKGALPLENALALCRQIAEGLEAAHEKGIIHRDLKPGNVMITAEEKVKILDFGLAKALVDETQTIDPADSPTITEAMTQPGVVLGTAAYMSPEQAKGKSVDKRADIWAFGCILYECLTGKRAFEGETVTETLAAILKGEPDWQALPANTVQNIPFVLRRCLEKDINYRLRDAADMRIIIDEGRSVGEAEVAVKKPWSRLGWGLAAIMFVALAVIAFIHFGEKSSAPPQSMRFKLHLGNMENFSISPDGRHLVYGADDSDGVMRFWLRSLDSLDARPLPGTESVEGGFWSPDSRFVAFKSGGKLKKIDVSGGSPLVICNLSDSAAVVGGSWNQEDVVIYGTWGGGIMRVSAEGGTPSELTRIDPSKQEMAHVMPTFLPDRRHFLYFIFSQKPENSGTFVGSLDSSLEEQASKRVPLAGSVARYLPPQDSAFGQMLFVREQTLMVQQFDDKNLELVDEPVPVADQVASFSGFGLTLGFFSASKNGILVYRDSGNEVWTTASQELIWVDRQGKKIQSAAPLGQYGNFRLSSDEKRIVFDRGDTTNLSDIWVLDLIRGVPSRLTFDPGVDNLPIWTPDGLRVLFPSNRNGSFDLYIKNATGAGQEEILIKMGTITGWATNWSRDGSFVLYQIPGDKTGQDLWIAPQSDDQEPFPYLQSQFNEQAGAFSPDGKWVAYVSNETGRNEVYVQSFPLSSEKFQISNGGGSEPYWSEDGTELFYVASDRNLMATPIKLSPTFEPGLPKLLLPVPAKASQHSYAVSGDSQRFLIVNPSTEEEPAQPVTATIVVNWQAALKR
jgi:serine/threonine protein kinase